MQRFNFTPEFITEHTILSNRAYGTAILERSGVEIIRFEEGLVEAWVGGLDGKVVDGGGSRRRVEFVLKDSDISWNCTGNPKNHQIFCKHCVALALFMAQKMT
jgi:uncharacterized Zn finger protein